MIEFSNQNPTKSSPLLTYLSSPFLQVFGVQVCNYVGSCFATEEKRLCVPFHFDLEIVYSL